ncbi:MAG: hypothetical protein ACR2F8_13945 [Caulobacteraceae bacterium]
MKITTLASLATAASLLALGAGGVQAKMSPACQADAQRLCASAGTDRRQARQCMKSHMNDVSPDCRSAMEAAKAKRQQRKAAKASAGQSGGQAGPDQGPPPQ